MSQEVRLDGTNLSPLLATTPAESFQISAIVMTNPITVNGQISAGPAGDRVKMLKLMERKGSPITNQEVLQRLVVGIQNGEPADKVRAIETLATYYTILS